METNSFACECKLTGVVKNCSHSQERDRDADHYKQLNQESNPRKGRVSLLDNL